MYTAPGWPILHMQVDPHLLVLPRMPQLPLAPLLGGGEGGGEGGGGGGGEGFHMDESPRPLLRRRRIASLEFDDGSSCSCSPRCSEDGEGGEGCCGDMADGRRALCHSPVMGEGLDALDGQAAQRPRCPVVRPGLASRGGGTPLRLLVSNLASFPVRLLLLNRAGEEQSFKTLLVDQARAPAATHFHSPAITRPPTAPPRPATSAPPRPLPPAACAAC